MYNINILLLLETQICKDIHRNKDYKYPSKLNILDNFGIISDCIVILASQDSPLYDLLKNTYALKQLSFS